MMKTQRFFIRLIFALGLMGWGQFVSAQDYYWRFTGYGLNLSGSSPQNLCSSGVSSFDSLFNGFTHSFRPHLSYFKSDFIYLCSVSRTDKNDSTKVSSFDFSVDRTGQGCTLPSIYNPEIRSCEAPEPEKCEPTIGKRIGHYHNFGTLGANANEAPITVCENSCQYSNTFETPKCNREFPDKAFCSLTYLGNGVECTEGDASNPSNFDQPPAKPPADQKPELSHEQKCDQWVTGADGVTRRTCTSKDEYKNPGQLKCEDTNGYLKCTAGNPPPDYQQTNKTEETKKETNADGSTTTETNTTTDKTTCKGAKPCTSTSTDEKETSGTNPDGTPGDEEKECTGTGCKPADKDNDGIPDDEEAEEGEERTATLGACDAPVSCSGDAIDCAVLQEEKSQRCLAEENSDYPKYKSEIESQLTEDKYQLEKETVQVPGLLEGSTRFLPSSCPPPKSVSLSGGKNITLEFDLFCNFASGIAPVIVALALLFGALYVGRSFGGG